MSSEYDSDGSDNPWASKGFVAAGAVLGVIVTLAVVVVVSNLFGGTPQPPAAEGDAVVTDQPADPAAAESDSVCGLPDVQLTGTVDTPPTAEWTLLGTVAVPQRDDVGPGVIEDDGFRYCFARTPEGALFAAVNMGGMGSRPQLEGRLVEQLVAEGPGRDAALAKVGTHSGSSDDPGVRLQVAGFRILSYTSTRATVDLAFQVSTGATMAWAIDLVWEEGDWKFQATAEGEPTSEMAQIPDLAGYLLWGGA